MNKKVYVKIGISLIFIIGIISIRIYSLKEINKSNIDVSKYIQYMDDISTSKVQVNWKYVASIIGSKYNNKFKDINESEIKKIGNEFIREENGTYSLFSFNEVLDKLDLRKSQKKRAVNYLKDLENYGLKPSSLKPDGKYMRFINDIKAAAISNYKNYKILPSITIAQAILESNWGESKLSADYNNLFGIKANPSWKGESILIDTKEYYNQSIKDKFRVYKTKDESLIDHAKFLSENKRYKNVFEKKTYIEQAEELQKAGYSTVMDKEGNYTYKKLLVQIIQQYNLQLIDSNINESK